MSAKNESALTTELASDRVRTITPTLIMWVAPSILFITIISISIHFGNSYFENCDSKESGEDRSRCISESASEYRSAWGQFGDFIGGTINPIFGFLTICLLVAELRESRRAAERAERAHVSTEAALRDQLDAARGQNNFSNYYKHLEEFIQYMSIEATEDPEVHLKIDLRRFHWAMYPNTRSVKNDFVMDEIKINASNKAFLHLIFRLKCFLDNEARDYFQIIGAYDMFVEDYCRTFSRSIVIHEIKLYEIEDEGGYRMVPLNVESMLDVLTECVKVITRAIKFEPQMIKYDYLENLHLTLENLKGIIGGPGLDGGQYFNPLGSSNIEVGSAKLEGLIYQLKAN